jgi:hypothetical protein
VDVSHEQQPLKKIKKGTVKDVDIVDIPRGPMAAMWIPLEKVTETK